MLDTLQQTLKAASENNRKRDITYLENRKQNVQEERSAVFSLKWFSSTEIQSAANVYSYLIILVIHVNNYVKLKI